MNSLQVFVFRAALWALLVCGLLAACAKPAIIREPEILYLAPSEAPELWRVTANNGRPVSLTETGGRVFDYAVSKDGEWIAYSAQNEVGGMDLWETNRDGNSLRQLLPCGADWCINPEYAPDGSRLVYSRRQASGLPGAQPGAPRLWLLDRETLETGALYDDPNMGGFEPSWSPDGRYLAFFDGLSQGLRLYDFETRKDILIDSEMGMTGTWAPDGQRILYNQYEITSEQPSVSIYELNVQNGESRKILGGDTEPSDYSIPAYAPDGKMLALALRPFSGNPGKQLWLVPIENGQPGTPRQITFDPVYNHAGYHWPPDGTMLVFQRLKLGSSRSLPEIAVWDMHSEETRVVASDAFQPRWLP